MRSIAESLESYINGNYLVSHEGMTGTTIKRALRFGEDLKAEFPDSIDLKITNKCMQGCPYCHEKSVPSGKSFNFEKTTELLSQLPEVPIELAIGGGNVLEIPEQTLGLLRWANRRGFLTRITLNRDDLVKRKPVGTVLDVIRESGWVGVSIDRFHEDLLGDWTRYVPEVVHIIAGVFPLKDLERTLKEYSRILILGFKQFGRASNMKIPDLTGWREVIKKNMKVYGMGFDNLAVEQLGIEDLVSKRDWDKLYFGDEFTCSMYVDAVSEMYAPTSRSTNRTPWSECGILEYFKRHELQQNFQGRLL